MIKTLVPILILISTPALAIDQAYVGVWAPSAEACTADDRSPFRVTSNGIDGREWGCNVKRAARDRVGWLLHLSCAAEGNEYVLNLRWHLSPDGHLHETNKGKLYEYVRCKDSDYRPT